MATMTALSPQFLVADLNAAVAHYERCLGFRKKIDYGGFYASVVRDGTEIHLKCADKLPGERQHKLDNEHLDAYVEVDDVKALYEELAARGASILRGVERHPWGVADFWVLDLDGYVICFADVKPDD